MHKANQLRGGLAGTGRIGKAAGSAAARNHAGSSWAARPSRPSGTSWSTRASGSAGTSRRARVANADADIDQAVAADIGGGPHRAIEQVRIGIDETAAAAHAHIGVGDRAAIADIGIHAEQSAIAAAADIGSGQRIGTADIDVEQTVIAPNPHIDQARIGCRSRINIDETVVVTASEKAPEQVLGMSRNCSTGKQDAGKNC
ncbi:hypothetical protein GCM10007913_07640 [Devosia yakushimensis]|uniref:Uncharacterized protein n=1 Tax=Devosia yakushimensis TaxID=470028 RepID=A0ABQ5UBZ2_9HYPH|nr:hypothetical protein GCM10007913_07640 [Devosia yakushimensis]